MTVTFNELFATLKRGQIVKGEGTRELVWYGWTYDSNENTRVAKFYSLPHLRVVNYGGDTLDQESNLTVVVDDKDELKTIDGLAIQALILHHCALERSNNDGQRLLNMEKAYDAAISDLAFLNGKMNEYADETKMCSDYERRIFKWSEEMDFKLKGRERDWSVPVQIPGFGNEEYCITVQATSADTARQQVQMMPNADVIRELAKRYYFDSVTITFEGDPVF